MNVKIRFKNGSLDEKELFERGFILTCDGDWLLVLGRKEMNISFKIKDGCMVIDSSSELLHLDGASFKEILDKIIELKIVSIHGEINFMKERMTYLKLTKHSSTED